MSQVKRLKAMGIEFDDPKIWKLLEDLDNMPQYLAQKEKKRLERIRFVDSVWRKAIEQAGILKKDDSR